MLTIREELPQDIPAIHNVNVEAFGSEVEATLVDEIRQAGAIVLSLVAVMDELVVGHILFSPVTISSETSESPEQAGLVVGLGPMAVLPGYQKQGIGSQMVWNGLNKCLDMGHGTVVVLGHPKYYPRFGFQTASDHGFRLETEAPDEAFMVVGLHSGALSEVGGTVRYRPEFLAAE